MRGRMTILAFGGVAMFAAPAAAQQIVETTTGQHVAAGSCSVSEAMLTEIQDHRAAADAATRQKLNALLDSALARSKTRKAHQSPVTFHASPPRS